MTEENVGTEIGNVQWFDQKKGIGFIKIITPTSDFLNKEVFVHYSSINAQSNYKKLYPGENVSLNVSDDPDKGDDKRYSCMNVTGLYGSPLLVDNENYIYRVIKKRE